LKLDVSFSKRGMEENLFLLSRHFSINRTKSPSSCESGREGILCSFYHK
jgi:hypothetical protein